MSRLVVVTCAVPSSCSAVLCMVCVCFARCAAVCGVLISRRGNGVGRARRCPRACECPRVESAAPCPASASLVLFPCSLSSRLGGASLCGATGPAARSQSDGEPLLPRCAAVLPLRLPLRRQRTKARRGDVHEQHTSTQQRHTNTTTRRPTQWTAAAAGRQERATRSAALSLLMSTSTVQRTPPSPPPPLDLCCTRHASEQTCTQTNGTRSRGLRRPAPGPAQLSSAQLS